MMKIFVGLGLSCMALQAGGSTKLPPIGQRKYVIDEASKTAPVMIEGADQGHARAYLKDPVSTAPIGRPEPPPVVQKPRPRPRAAKSAQLRFRGLPVSGKLTRPRVEFTHDVLPVGRADEPITQNFFPRVFDPALDESF